MPGRIYGTLRRLALWQWLLLSIIASELLTFAVSWGASRALWGRLSNEVLIIGIIDSAFVSFVVVGLALFALATFRKLYDRLENRNRELSLALSEIRKLQGILPICSFCKQIRNDEGYYEQIENYITDHSEADFSHTVCPDCAKKHYPELYPETPAG